MAPVDLSRILCGNLTIPGNLILEGLTNDPSDALKMPDWAFLIKHGDRRVLWNTGLAKDLAVYPPAAQKRMPTFQPVPPSKDLRERLEEAGIEASSITDVVFSHAHWDHQQPIHTMFPQATAWLGPGTTEHTGKGWPSVKDSGMFAELLDPERRIGAVRELSLETDSWSEVGPFDRAFDFFGDGSMMLCHAPGHIPGNMCAIVETEKGRVCLGGDCGHHSKLLTGEAQIGQWTTEDGRLTSMHHSIDDARSTLSKLRYLKEEGVVIALAHDPDFEWDQVIA